mgnify:CR=1 FL=1
MTLVFSLISFGKTYNMSTSGLFQEAYITLFTVSDKKSHEKNINKK